MYTNALLQYIIVVYFISLPGILSYTENEAICAMVASTNIFSAAQAAGGDADMWICTSDGVPDETVWTRQQWTLFSSNGMLGSFSTLSGIYVCVLCSGKG